MMTKAHYNGCGYSYRYFFRTLLPGRKVCPQGYGNIRCGKKREATPRWAQDGQTVTCYGFVDYSDYREPLTIEEVYEYDLIPDDPTQWAELQAYRTRF